MGWARRANVVNMAPAMESALVAVVSTSFVAAACLLWLAAETGAAAFGRSRSLRHALIACSVILAATGLWWPAHVLQVHDVVRIEGMAPHWLAWVPALTLATLAGSVGAFLRRRVWSGAAALMVAMPVAAYLHAMFSAPGLFRLTTAPTGLGVLTLTLGLSAALIVARLEPGSARNATMLRVLGSLIAAALVSLGAALSIRADRVPDLQGREWPTMIVLLLFAMLLRIVLRHTGAGMAVVRPRRARTGSLDHLTGLPTRLYFENRLDAAAKKSAADQTNLAVLFIDLDGFKPVNDTFGHNNGDRMLEQVGQRLQALAKGADLAARIGGDQFLLMAAGFDGRDGATQIATRVIDALSQPYQVDEREIGISCSVGIALYPDKCVPIKLIARADAAMYAAKKAGGSRHSFYAPEMDADVQHNFDTLAELRQAIANDELELHFQPKIEVRSGKITGAEALIRWRHPTRGLLSPAAFLPLAERSGLIGPLGDWLIEAACKQSRAWRDKGLRMRVAINLSAHQMRQEDIVDRISVALQRHRIHPSLLTCEITESTAMEDTVATQETFRQLGELGTHLSIDDFGTGYSSLSYLRQLPAEELKIDASFVKDVDTSPDARAIVDAVVKLAHALGLKVVAEGVETLRQQKALIALGVDELQGYLFAKPMTARALLMWAMDDRAMSAVFRPSLFGETRQALRDSAMPSLSRF